MAQFAAERVGIDYDAQSEVLFLYHGTNCYRRWEINRTGAIEPGRRNYSFFCTRASEAYKYARAACLRDCSLGSPNSLAGEPIVLKAAFNQRTWLQVDFIQEVGSPECEEGVQLTVATLGPILSSAIVDVLYCTHGRRLGFGIESIRIFDDGSLLSSIQHLRGKLMSDRVDAWMLKRLGNFSQAVTVRFSGGEMPEITREDDLRRLRQVRA